MRALVIALAAFAFATPAAADRFALEYDGAALGLVPLGRINVDATVTPRGYRITTRIRSSGLMNLFERTDLTATAAGRIDESGVSWRRYELDHRYSRKHRIISMRAGADGAVVAEITPNYRLWGEPPTSEAQQRISRDPLSTMMAMAVDVAMNRRCAGAYPTFDGRFHYLMELSGGRFDDYDGGGYAGEILKCDLAYIAVAGFEASDRGRQRIPEGEVWFALAEQSHFAPPVRIETPLSAGGAVVRLTSWLRAEVEVADAIAEDASP